MPRPWRSLFAGHKATLASHRGWDPGSLELAERLAQALDAPLLAGTVTRLLADLNRSPTNPARFSEFTCDLPPADKAAIVAEHWQPHWSAYREHLDRLPGRVMHIASHSFTPVLHGHARNAEIGLLYDPRRPAEKAFCHDLRAALRKRFPDWRIRLNYPYRGTSDGIGRFHRRLFGDDRLVTMELEVRQDLVAADEWRRWRKGIVAACVDVATVLESR